MCMYIQRSVFIMGTKYLHSPKHRHVGLISMPLLRLLTNTQVEDELTRAANPQEEGFTFLPAVCLRN